MGGGCGQARRRTDDDVGVSDIASSPLCTHLVKLHSEVFSDCWEACIFGACSHTSTMKANFSHQLFMNALNLDQSWLTIPVEKSVRLVDFNLIDQTRTPRLGLGLGLDSLVASGMRNFTEHQPIAKFGCNNDLSSL